MRIRFGTLLFSVLIALVLWGMAHGTSEIERGFDIPIVFNGVPEELVITAQSADVVNIRVRGNAAALRNVSPTQMEYVVNISGARAGVAIHEVDPSLIELPRGAQPVSRSPASIEFELERRGRKAVRVRPDVTGSAADGFRIVEVSVDPPRVWLTGARREVLRLAEVQTETIDVTGLTTPVEREVRLSLGRDHVWPEGEATVSVRIVVEAVADPEERGAVPDVGAAAPG